MFHPANMSNFCLCIAAVIRLSFLKSAAKIYYFSESTMVFDSYFSRPFGLYTLCIKSLIVKVFLHSHVNTNYHSIAHNDFTTKDLFPTQEINIVDIQLVII